MRPTPTRRPRRARGGLRTAALAASLVLLASPLAALQETPSLVMRVGAVDGPGSLAPVQHVEISPSGEILVVQPGTPAISVFDSAGAYLRDIGRTGSGPGEFRNLGAVGWTGDTLWVMDVSAGRLHLFDRNLEFARTITPGITDFEFGRYRMVPGPLLADRSILAIAMHQPGETELPLSIIDETGVTRSTLHTVQMEGRSISVSAPAGGSRRVDNPWDSSQLWVVAADGASLILVSRPIAGSAAEGRFEVARIGLSGDTVFRRQFTYRPVAMRAADVEREHARLAERLSRGAAGSGGEGAILQAVRRDVPAPGFYPPIRHLIAGKDGTIWLELRPESASHATWEVLDQSAERVRRVRLPADLGVRGADAHRVWGVRTDELDVPFVEIYRLEPIASR